MPDYAGKSWDARRISSPLSPADVADLVELRLASWRRPTSVSPAPRTSEDIGLMEPRDRYRPNLAAGRTAVEAADLFFQLGDLSAWARLASAVVGLPLVGYLLGSKTADRALGRR